MKLEDLKLEAAGLEFARFAGVAKLADAQDSGSCVRKDVEVRLLSSALTKKGAFGLQRFSCQQHPAAIPLSHAPLAQATLPVRSQEATPLPPINRPLPRQCFCHPPLRQCPASMGRRLETTRILHSMHRSRRPVNPHSAAPPQPIAVHHLSAHRQQPETRSGPGRFS